MQVNRVGYLGYKLYRLGWQNAVHQNLDSIEHLVFKVLYYYRRGFAEGSAYIKANHLEEMLH
ncbi:MAG: hypothetical protein HC939_13685 [Pleurocapsa sp. SU_5_0]|nr:hypothetical protein [Pleurocapsa sp. SU_5_0]NJO95156.1 hypothetical protein [Pleurocapsa sp. CRU_1_2]NJR47666.1 hypothetical protein [Hyellaceae cyanobacterium CSU_1_1]